MITEEHNGLEQVQRVQVEFESQPTGRCVRIRVENYHTNLGWCTAGSLSFPLHQLPLLEQAIRELSAQPLGEGAPACGDIIPFPGLRSTTDFSFEDEPEGSSTDYGAD
ncbi:hypothetical protein SBV1_810029 [Verrucomicrobia bacterium]|nr:hypothetical protein SBV1_810029 [Verrucomicrobiota bacterium]